MSAISDYAYPEPATLEWVGQGLVRCEAARYRCMEPAPYWAKTRRYRGVCKRLCREHAAAFAKRHKIALPEPR